ncbi:unnamed protein product, partial [Mesorhabditis belari]|uniref:Glycosyl hydrolase family 13 catalytic domain-containing protein n=1 Tax=Mesorhabditis belari TaxID=2138241 RepID=A0AAF3JBJ8_9BILA
MAASEEEKGALVESGQAKFDKDRDTVAVGGGAKIVGLTKEQLEQYKNDPFWKPFRYILFALFWLAWLAMFAGAILIVLLSPKCAAKQEPDWWQTKVSYQLLTPTFYDTNGDAVGDFPGIREKLDFLRKIGITTIYPTPVVTTDKNEIYNEYDVTDHQTVDVRFGTEEDFKKLIDLAHDRDMYLVMDLPISCVSPNHPWFKDPLKADYFVFSTEAKPSPKFIDSPKSSRKELGSTPSKNPVLNWKNTEIQEYFNATLEKYLLLGVDGFHIDHISLLATKPDGSSDHDASIAILKKLTTDLFDFVKHSSDVSNKKIVLFSSLKDVDELEVKARQTGGLHYVIDSSFSNLDSATCSSGVASCVHDALTTSYKKHDSDNFTPFWQFSNANSRRLASRFDADTANLLTFTQLTLPGAISVYYGQEIGLENVEGRKDGQRGLMQWKEKGNDHHGFIKEKEFKDSDIYYPEQAKDKGGDNFEAQYKETDSALKVFKKLAQLRQRDPALILGTTVRDTLMDDVITFGRFVPGVNGTAEGSAYIVVLNFGEKETEVDCTKLADKGILPTNKALTTVEVSAFTTGVKHYEARQKLDVSSTKIKLPAKQGILLKL